MPDLTRAELARQLGVAHSTVTRAIANGQRLHASDPETYPAPPEPVNPGEPQPRYPSAEMVEWWPRRPQPGRPAL